MKSNSRELFEPGKEVIAYEKGAGLLEKANYYAAHDKEREEVAEAGRARTLRKHLIACRAEELNNIFRLRLAKS